MKKLLFIFLTIAVISVAVFAQHSKSKNTALPGDIASWTGPDSDKVLDNAVIKSRLKKLLGKKNYSDFTTNWETVGPLEKKGNVIFVSGCLLHACGHLESAIAIDLANNTIHAGIYNEELKTRIFNERGTATPRRITLWANHLSKRKKTKN
jgi:hypothetical protein